MHTPVLPAAVHGEGKFFQARKSFCAEVLPSLHRIHDVGEGCELRALAAEQRFSFEERNDPCQEVVPPAYDVHQRGVACAAMVLPDCSTPKPLADEVEDLRPLRVLADVELRHELPTQP